MITNIEKVNSQIIISTMEKPDKPIIYDVKTHTLYSFSGRVVKSLPTIAKCLSNNLCECGNTVNGYYGVLEAIKKALKNDFSLLNRIEKFIPYLAYIENYLNLPDECPKGYIDFIIKNDCCISCFSLRDFNILKKVDQMKQQEKDFFWKYLVIKNLEGQYITLGRESYTFSNMSQKEKKALLKIVKTHLKTHINFTYIRNALYSFFSVIANFGENWIDFIDTNRDLIYNHKTLQFIKEKYLAEKIKEKQSKIIEIENLSNDDFKIIVPLELVEFSEEGRQQNNCVGSYYHNSIVEGQNLIYFIRKAITPEKSYITNRFSILDEGTVETRKVNNTDNNDKKALELIKKIDEKINEILE